MLPPPSPSPTEILEDVVCTYMSGGVGGYCPIRTEREKRHGDGGDIVLKARIITSDCNSYELVAISIRSDNDS